jgi:pimeloyl-ACP methyl ester carboxylesterase
MKLIPSILCLTFVVAISCENKNVNESIINEMSAQRGYKNWYLDSFRCGLFVPPSYDADEKYPLIIFLHGYTDTTTWNLGWYNDPLLSADPCIVMTPKCPREEEAGWGNSLDAKTSPMMKKTYEMLDLVGKAFNLDPDRFYIYGSSMGGYGTFGAIKKNPDMFAAGYVECANGNTDMANIMAKIPFWMFHGSEDSTVPVQGARDMYNAVKAAGGSQIRYTEYQGVGHNVWDYTRYETTIPWWLLAQRKGAVHSNPDSVINFQASLTNDKKVLLEWNLPDDSTNPDNKIWYCKIFRDGSLLKEVDNIYTSYTDSVVAMGNTYLYSIAAINFYFKESDISSPVSVTIK